MTDGIGAMLHRLGGGSANDPAKYYGREIAAVSLDKVAEKLEIQFTDKTKIAIWDKGQSCCENRHMTCDDDLQLLVGHKLTRIEAKEGPETSDDYGDVHEQVFVEIGTDAGFITIANHNEHNGYYGGFGLTITEEGAQ